MKKIIISLLIAAFVIGAFAACAPDDSPSGLIKQIEKLVEKHEKLKNEFLELLASDPSDIEKAEARAEALYNEGGKLEEEVDALMEKIEALIEKDENAFTEEQLEKIGELQRRIKL